MEICFGLPGVHNLALWEALRASSIRLVGVRHEQAAAYAADGYARATGRLGVALTTTGPGAANTLGRGGRGVGVAVAGARDRDRHPVGAAPPGEYRGVLHETTGQAAMFAPVVKSVHLGADRRRRRGGRGRGDRVGADRADAAGRTSRSRPTCWPPRSRTLAGADDGGLGARSSGRRRSARRRRAAAAVGRRRSARRGGARYARWPSGSRRR